MKKKCFIFLMVLLFGFSFDTEAKAEQKEEWQNELSLEQADLSLQENTKQSFSIISSMLQTLWMERRFFLWGNCLTVSVSR